MYFLSDLQQIILLLVGSAVSCGLLIYACVSLHLEVRRHGKLAAGRR